MNDKNNSKPHDSKAAPVSTPAPQATPLKLWEKILYPLIGLVVIGGIGLLIWSSVADNNKQDARIEHLKNNGTQVTGTANGEYREFTDRNRRSSSVKYKAEYDYTFTNLDRDGRQDESSAYGDKVYDTIEEIEANKGKEVTIYYDPNDASKGTYVVNEP